MSRSAMVLLVAVICVVLFLSAKRNAPQIFDIFDGFSELDDSDFGEHESASQFMERGWRVGQQARKRAWAHMGQLWDGRGKYHHGHNSSDD